MFLCVLRISIDLFVLHSLNGQIMDSSNGGNVLDIRKIISFTSVFSEEKGRVGITAHGSELEAELST